MDKSSAIDMQSKASITSSHDGDVDESILPYVPSHADASADNNWDHGVHVDLLSQGAPRRAQGVWLEWDQLKVEVSWSDPPFGGPAAFFFFPPRHGPRGGVALFHLLMAVAWRRFCTPTDFSSPR